MFGGESTSWAMTYVFFRLIFSSKSLYGLLKRLMTFWRFSAEWAVMAASSAYRRSRRYFIWTLDFAISLERLQSFQSDLVWRKIPSVASPKACFSRKAKHIPNKIVARTHPFFTSPRILKGSDVEPSKSTVPFKSLRKDLMVLRSLGGHPILGRILNRPSLLTR